jgi:hypothetical protein
MREGLPFLHRLWLTLLLYLQPDLMAEGEEDSVIIKLGANHLRALSLPWPEIIQNALKLHLP